MSKSTSNLKISEDLMSIHSVQQQMGVNSLLVEWNQFNKTEFVHSTAYTDVMTLKKPWHSSDIPTLMQ